MGHEQRLKHSQGYNRRDDIPGFLPKGSELELLVRVDESMNITEAFLSSFDETVEFETKTKVILSSEEEKDYKAKTKLTLGDDLPDSAEGVLDELSIETGLNQG